MNCKKVVIAIDRIKCSELGETVRLGNRMIHFPEDAVWENIPIRVPASLVISDKQDSKNTIYNAVLKFKALCELDSSDRYAWRVKLADGRYMALGSDRRPFPVMIRTENMPANITDNHQTEVTVTYDSPNNVPYIV